MLLRIVHGVLARFVQSIILNYATVLKSSTHGAFCILPYPAPCAAVGGGGGGTLGSIHASEYCCAK